MIRLSTAMACILLTTSSTMALGADAKSGVPTLSASLASNGVATPGTPRVPYASMWVDATGDTHVAHCTMSGMALKSYAPPAQPEWFGIAPDQIKSVTFAVLPVGYVGTWHHAPGPQWVITLSGRWSVQTTNGNVLVQGPGEAQFNADMSTKPGRNGKIGHLSRTVGNQPNVQMIVALKSAPGASFVGKTCSL